MSHRLLFTLAACLLSACTSPTAIPPANTSPPRAPSAAPSETLPPTSAVPSSTPRGQPMEQTPPSLKSPYAPQPGDDRLTRSTMYVDSAQLRVLTSYPPQVQLSLKGSLPTPCHQLRVLVNPPDAQKRIQVDVYSLTKPGQICVQILQPIDVSIPLGSFAPGHYTVWVNGNKIGEFDS